MLGSIFVQKPREPEKQRLSKQEYLDVHACGNNIITVPYVISGGSYGIPE
jgi:hypothetical protein